MATQKVLQKLTRPVAADYSAKEFYCMDLNGSAQWELVSEAGAEAMGILQDDPDTAGDYGTCAGAGISKAIYGGTVDEGDPLTTDSSGRLVESTDPTDYVLARCLVAGVVSDIGRVLITHEGLASSVRPVVRSATVTISAAELAALNTTPKVLVDHSALVTAGEVASGDVLVFLEAILNVYGGAANYDQNQNSIVKYQTAGGGATVSTTLANFFNGAAAGTLSTIKQLVTDITPEADQDLVLTSSASPKNAAGDRLCRVTTFYTVYTPGS